ncbi:MAG: hydrogenase nickel incorporation protein HypB [Oscillospiraceae bacterium]|nr:hydrogenase nickel incorporation protein HypB [Oscillospiraceae bacterium]
MDYKIIDVKERVLADNEAAAARTRALLREKGLVLVNLMGSPGAGKTSVLLGLLEALPELRIGVMEADVDSDVDAKTVSEAGAKVIQLHTGGLCHMDADMTARGLEALGVLPASNLPCLQGRGTGLEAGGGVCSDLDLVFLENIGNLVCPAEFDVGADLKMMILSVPEGDDKPLKYPLMFTVSDVMLVNKMDAAPIFDFDLAAAEQRAKALNPEIRVFPISAKEGRGLEPVAELLRGLVEERRGAK